MIYPNNYCALFCYWLLNSSYQRFSTSQVAAINAMSTAATTGASVTTSQYNYFIFFTAPYLRAYTQWSQMQPYVALPPSYDAYTTAWLANVSAPSAQTIYAVDTFFKQLRNDGNLLLDYCFVFAQDQQANANVSIVNSGLYAATPIASPAWSATGGYTGNGSTQYIKTNYISSVDGVNYTLNSASFGVYTRQSIAAGIKLIMGALSATGYDQLGLNFTGFGTIVRINELTYTASATVGTKGFFSVVRSGASAGALYLNGSSVLALATASSALSTVADYYLCENELGTPLYFDTNQIALAFKGSGAINQILFNSAVNTLMTNLGSHY